MTKEIYLTIFSCHPALRTDYRRFANELAALAHVKTLVDLSAATRRINEGGNGDIWYSGGCALPEIFARDFTADEISRANAHSGVLDSARHGEIYRAELPRQQAEAMAEVSFVLETREAARASACRRMAAGNRVNLGDLKE